MDVVRPNFLDNIDWWKYDENEVVVLTDIAPPSAVIEYNEMNKFSKNYLGIDYIIHPQDFYNMRKRIKYDDDKIIHEMRQIYTVEELAALRAHK